MTVFHSVVMVFYSSQRLRCKDQGRIIALQVNPTLLYQQKYCIGKIFSPVVLSATATAFEGANTFFVFFVVGERQIFNGKLSHQNLWTNVVCFDFL